MEGNQLRRAFLDYFASKGHEIVPSASLVPHNDPTLLFTNAGMVQFKDVFLELEERPYKRATSSQKCVRAGGKHNDLDTVGKTARHHTFFEMLGNFSFGDYFKEGAITYAWEFLTEVIKLDPERLYITVYLDDDEAVELWQKITGVPAERILRLGEKDNFWSMGDTGPCGPCSEILYDRGEDFRCDAPECGIGKCDCDRWLEIWNLVFMQFDRDDKGVMTPLPHPCIDTGMGLERVASILQDVPSNYDTDLLRRLIDFIVAETGQPYYEDSRGFPMRVIADHARSCTFLIADGVLPSNEGRGYVLRRILRRAVRFAKLLGKDDVFLARVVPVVVELMGGQFPEIREKQDFIVKVIANEEERFHLTISEGMKVAADKIAALRAEGKTEISGADAFKLYDTYGFPLDLTEDIALENDFTVDKDGFEAAMEEQRRRGRESRSGETGNELDIQLSALLTDVTATQFSGYTTLTDEGAIRAIIAEGERRPVLDHGLCYLATDRTPCYAESGGQVGDRGLLRTAQGEGRILTTFKLPSGIFIHKVEVVSGVLAEGDAATLTVTEQLRLAAMRNHTATHLMHKALREVLGNHANQAGSLVNEERLRFDFNHFSAVSAEEIRQIEDRVNEMILACLPVTTKETTIDEAKAAGAMALFGEKYGDIVRFVDVGGWSRELCGGTHVQNTGQIGVFKIVSESSIGAGLRRIEAVTGHGARQYYNREEEKLIEIEGLLKAKTDDVLPRIKSLLQEIKDKDKEIAAIKQAQAADQAGSLLAQAETCAPGQALVAALENVDMNGLRDAADKLKENRDDLALVLFAANEGKVNIVAVAGKNWQSRGLHAGNAIKAIAPIVGGGGGGRPDMAQAGGKNIDKIAEAMSKAKELLRAIE